MAEAKLDKTNSRAEILPSWLSKISTIFLLTLTYCTYKEKE